jgi:hypothetical protein
MFSKQIISNFELIKNENVVAIIDDDINAAETLKWDLEDAGYNPFYVSEKRDHPKDLAEYISKHAIAAICDHRLSPYGYASFHGADIVAQLYKLNIPAILMTQFIEIDKDVSIREFRRYIPVVLKRRETDPDRIRVGLNYCLDELKGKFSEERKPHRTLVRVLDLGEEANEKVVDVALPGWFYDDAVRLPQKLIPIELHSELKPDFRMIAEVNIGADSSEKLFFSNFKKAPDINEDDGLA